MTEKEHGSIAPISPMAIEEAKSIAADINSLLPGEMRQMTFWHNAALKMAAALSRPVQEPVCTVSVIGAGGHRWLTPHPLNALDAMPVGTPLYAAPQPAHGTSATERVANPLPVSELLTAEQALERIADTPFKAMVLTPGWAKEFAAAHLAAIRSAPAPDDWFSQVVSFFIKHDMLDARDEYDISDVIGALSDNYAPATPSPAPNAVTAETERVRLWNENRDIRASLDVEKAVTDSMRIERDLMRAALKQIATPRDCGCKPSCQCNIQESLEIEVDALRDLARSALSTSTPNNQHEFVPNKKYPWFCAHCGYAPHEPLMHLATPTPKEESK